MFAIGFPGEHECGEEVMAEEVTDSLDEVIDSLLYAQERSADEPLWFGAKILLLVLQGDGTTRWEVLGGVKEGTE